MQAINSLTDMTNSLVSHEQKSPKTGQLSQESFIKLLLTQLKAQDPTSPFDSSTMMQQVSQLTSLSASHEMEKTVKDLNANLNSTQILSASQLVGKLVQVSGEKSTLSSEAGLTGSVMLPQSAEHTTITIRDEQDRLVKTIELGASQPGLLDFHWDGLNSEGQPSNPGLYHVSANATMNDETKSLETMGALKITSVSLDPMDHTFVLNLEGGGKTKLNDVVKIL